MNRITIKIKADKSYTYTVPYGKKLSDVIRNNRIPVGYPCAGRGICGKCRVLFVKGAPLATSRDLDLLGESLCAEGYRLSCMAILKEDAEIIIESREDIVVDNNAYRLPFLFEKKSCISSDSDDGSMRLVSSINGVTDNANEGDDRKSCAYKIGIDIGTTTIEAVLMELKDGGMYEAARSYSVNHQKSYGADVISRIENASIHGKAKELRRIVCNDLEKIITDLLTKSGKKLSDISLCVISGNTTMLHLLLGYDCSGLGKYPYKVVNLDARVLSLQKTGLFPESQNDCQVVIFPGFSSFVGADILSGIYEIINLREYEDKKGRHIQADTLNKKNKNDNISLSKPFMLIDLGTNGEMALFVHGKIYCLSTAAGPVFEGGGIRDGIASVKGAISNAVICKDGEESSDNSCVTSRVMENGYRLKLWTIENGDITGICGSGVLELTSELVRNKMVDANGLLAEPFFDNGIILDEEKNIRFYQEDIRKVQLAKAAVFTAASFLLDKSRGLDSSVNIHGEKMDIYLAGGFCSKMNLARLRSLKMFPEQLYDSRYVDNIRILGNASLNGTICFMKRVADIGIEDALKELSFIQNKKCEINLSMEDGFDDKYYEALNF